MSDGKRKKRDWIREIIFRRRPKEPTEEGTSLHHSPANDSKPSTQHHTTPQKPPLKPQSGGAIGDKTFKPDPASQPGPASATAAAMDMSPTQAPAEVKGEQPISTAAGSIQAQSLWSRALGSGELSLQERKTLASIGLGVDCQEVASAVGSMTDGILNEKKGKLWKVKLGEEEVVLRDVGMKILRWVDKFKQIGDIIVQCDPVHAGLPWAGFRFLLQVDLNRSG